MADYAGITPWQVQQIWKSADLKPHRLKTFKISNDPQFAEKVVDLVGLYMDPPDNAVVLSVDEKTPDTFTQYTGYRRPFEEMEYDPSTGRVALLSQSLFQYFCVNREGGVRKIFPLFPALASRLLTARCA
jgi:hypothetical protein